MGWFWKGIGNFLSICALFAAVGFIFPGGLLAQGGTYINPHIRPDGTYVPGRYQNGSGGNIYLRQTQPIEMINPFTGRVGYENPYSNYNINAPSQYDPNYYNSVYNYRYLPR